MAKHTLFVGGIVPAASLTEIEDEFKKFGRCTCSFSAINRVSYRARS